MQTFFWDGRETRLESVVVQPFTNQVEMAMPNMASVVERVNSDASYRPLLSQMPGNLVTEADIASALAAYLRSFPRHQSRFDQYLSSGGREGLSDTESAGLILFKGKAGCVDCHHLNNRAPTFSDQKFHHAGISFEPVAGRIVPMLVRLDALQKSGQAIGQAILSDRDVAALGRFAVSRRPADLGAFRTPSLRNVAETSPYMHDGSVPTLSAAVEREIYYRGLSRGRPIELTVEEQLQLLAFLGTLTDQPTP